MPIPKLIATAVMMAANMAMAAMQKVEGPRLTDTRATVADYGTPSNNVIGSQMVPAHCVFAKKIEEQKKKRKGKSGKQVSYTGYGTFMVQAAEHPCAAIKQIFMDNHLVYDATGSGEKIFALADDYEFEAHMRFMLGAADQERDPDMLAYIEARDGPGTCPAYRDQTNVYFERIPLENFGNRLPDVKMLVDANASTAVEPLVTLDFANAQYAIGSEAKTLGEVVQAGPYPFFDPAQIVAGLGFRRTQTGVVPFTSESTAELTPAAFAPLGSAGFTMVVDFTLSSADTGAGNGGFARLAVAAQPSDFVGGTGMQAGYTAGAPPGPSDSAFLYEQSVIVLGTVAEPLGGGTRRLAATFTAAGLQGAVDCGAAVATAAPSEFTADTATINIGAYSDPGESAEVTVSRARFFAPVSTANLELLACTGEPAGGASAPTLATLLTRVALRGGAIADEFDFSLVDTADYAIDGYKWTQGTGDQICAHLCDLFDVDLRPHDFVLQALPRGGASQGSIDNGEFVAGDSTEAGEYYKLVPTADEDLPRRVFLSYADRLSGYEPNTAMPVGGPDRGASGSQGEFTIDASTLVLDPDRAQQLIERRQRRTRFGRTSAEFAVTRQRIAIEAGDVFTPVFDGHEQIMRCTKLTIGADGVLASEWERDDPRIAALPGSEGAIAAGYTPETVPETVDSLGEVMDLPLLIDAHEQSAPFAYLVAGPEEPGPWMGADVAVSDTGELDSFVEGWDGIASGDGAVMGTCVDALPEALPWVPDNGSSLTVNINAGQLTAATLDQLLADPTRNLAAVESEDGWELVQFMTPTLVAARQYAITGFLRGVRGTEWAIGGHEAGDRLVLLDGTVKRHTLGAGEIGDTDFYAFTSVTQAFDQGTAEALSYTGATHKPYAPVHGFAELDGADWLFGAERRTRLGGGSLDNQDVPLGESSEAWELHVLDGGSVVRTIVGVSLPLTYLEADQITDFGAPLAAAPDARLYQVDPTLALRGYPLAITGG